MQIGHVEVPDNYLTLRSSHLQDYQSCERMYFFADVLRWEEDRFDRSSFHLSFGSAWHVAQEYLLTHEKNPTTLALAYINFEMEWSRLYPVDGLITPQYTTEEFVKLIIMACDAVERNNDMQTVLNLTFDIPKSVDAKSPMGALRALFFQYFQNPFSRMNSEVLYTEIGFTVPLDDKYLMRGRIDAIMETPQGIVVVDHKTAGSMSQSYQDKWAMKIQTGTYSHFAAANFGLDKFRGFKIWTTVFKKTDATFIEIPVYLNKELLRAWHWETIRLVGNVERDFEALADCKPSDPIMKAFPKRGESCDKYFGCPYRDICATMANPLRICDAAPSGFRYKKAEEDEMRDTKVEIETTNMEDLNGRTAD